MSKNLQANDGERARDSYCNSSVDLDDNSYSTQNNVGNKTKLENLSVNGTFAKLDHNTWTQLFRGLLVARSTMLGRL